MLRRILHAVIWGTPRTYKFAPIVRYCLCGAYSLNGGYPTANCPTLVNEHAWLRKMVK